MKKSTKPASRPLALDTLAKVTGGEDAATIVSPRDAASGLPTGKRMH